jgi:hypothetical protein
LRARVVPDPCPRGVVAAFAAAAVVAAMVADPIADGKRLADRINTCPVKLEEYCLPLKPLRFAQPVSNLPGDCRYTSSECSIHCGGAETIEPSACSGYSKIFPS